MKFIQGASLSESKEVNEAINSKDYIGVSTTLNYLNGIIENKIIWDSLQPSSKLFLLKLYIKGDYFRSMERVANSLMPLLTKYPNLVLKTQWFNELQTREIQKILRRKSQCQVGIAIEFDDHIHPRTIHGINKAKADYEVLSESYNIIRRVKNGKNVIVGEIGYNELAEILYETQCNDNLHIIGSPEYVKTLVANCPKKY